MAANGKEKTSSAATTNGSLRGSQPNQTDADIEKKYRDFFWTYTEEPHRTRRLAIIKAHPEVGSSFTTSQPPSPSAALTETNI